MVLRQMANYMSDPDPARVVLLGCGDIGTALALNLHSRGLEVLALRRAPGDLPSQIPGQPLDYTDNDQLAALELQPQDILLFTPKPASFDEPGYRAGYPEPVQCLLSSWRSGPPRKVLYVSSTRVYGQDEGQWVNEETPIKPTGYAGKAIAESESMLLNSDHEVCIVRFAGIYGRWPSRLIQRIGRGEICAREPVHYGNRIHRDDCVGFLDHLLQKWIAGQALSTHYIGVDDAPVSQWEVESWLALEMGVDELTDVAAGARGANKRCSNQRLRESGYRLLYPNYRAGYGAMLAVDPTGS